MSGRERVSGRERERERERRERENGRVEKEWRERETETCVYCRRKEAAPCRLIAWRLRTATALVPAFPCKAWILHPRQLAQPRELVATTH